MVASDALLREVQEKTYIATLYHLGFYPGNKDVATVADGVLPPEQVNFLKELSKHTYDGLKHTREIYDHGLLDGVRSVFAFLGWQNIPDHKGEEITHLPAWLVKEIELLKGGLEIKVNVVPSLRFQ